jgi:predicted transposase/invertase (TIGR01784 family)
MLKKNIRVLVLGGALLGGLVFEAYGASVVRVGRESLELFYHQGQVIGRRLYSSSSSLKMGSGSPGIYARPTLDSAFKHMMIDPEVQLSFLRTFTGRGDIVSVMPHSVSVPAIKPSLKSKVRLSHRHMDFACRVEDGDIFIAEVQVRREDAWDARSLYYAAGVYSQQLAEGDSWSYLQNVYSVNILDHDTGSIKEDGDFERHYAFTDLLHPKEDPLPYIRVIQIELPRIDLGKVEEGPKKQWLRLFKEAYTMENAPEDFDPILKKALDQLDRRRWSGGLVRDYEGEELDLSRYTGALKDAKNEGKAEGKAEGRAEVAMGMITEGLDSSLVSKFTGLTLEEVKALKVKVLSGGSERA